MKSKKGDRKQYNSQKKILIIILVLTIIIVLGYIQRPTTNEEPKLEEPVPEESKEPEQTCTEMWICQDENTKAYRKSDCTFEQITDCPAGCENAECNEVIEALIELKEEPQEEAQKEPEAKERCTIGFKCLDENRRGYQSTNCMFNQVDRCDYGCKDGVCITEAPKEEVGEIEGTYLLTEGKLILNKTGWRFTDFDKKELFILEINEYDFKIKLYPPSLGYNYFRAESSRSNIWIMDKGVEEATRADCMDNIIDSNAYANLRTSQTLCMQTREKDIALVGGSWEGPPKEDTEITWKYYS